MTAVVDRPPVRQGSSRGWRIAGCLAAVAVLIAGSILRPATPHLGEQATGDEQLIGQIRDAGPAARNLSVIVIEPDGRVRSAYFGAAGPDRRYEIGSVSKALTGLVMADQVARGELTLEAPTSQYLPELEGTDAGAATVSSLVTHTSGLPRLAPGADTLLSAVTGLVWPTNPYWETREDLLDQARQTPTADDAGYEYSNLGSALAGQVGAAAADTKYSDLMRDRLFVPVGMTDTVVATAQDPAPKGSDLIGRSQPTWVMDGYVAAGGIVSTPQDLTTLTQAILAGTAPGASALDPRLDKAGGSQSEVGIFWTTTPYAAVLGPDAAGTLTWHNGQTGGYSSFVGIDRDRGRAVILLSDVAANNDDLAIALLHDLPAGG